MTEADSLEILRLIKSMEKEIGLVENIESITLKGNTYALILSRIDNITKIKEVLNSNPISHTIRRGALADD